MTIYFLSPYKTYPCVWQQGTGEYDEFTDHVMNLLYYIEGYKSCMNDTLEYLEVILFTFLIILYFGRVKWDDF